MRTLFLNPPSFEGFDGGAGSRWPASREIESYWYPVWLCYPAGMLPDSKSRGRAAARRFDRPDGRDGERFRAAGAVHFVPRFRRRRPHRGDDEGHQSEDEGCLCRSARHGRAGERRCGRRRPSISSSRRSSITRSPIIAKGTPLSELPGVSYWKDGRIQHNPEGRVIENLDELPWVTKIYKRDLDFRKYNVPFLLNPFISFYTTRGCPAMCTFCLWPQTHSGHRWRLRSIRRRRQRSALYARELPGSQGNLLRRRHLQLPEGPDH